jgi:hypothetical protein
LLNVGDVKMSRPLQRYNRLAVQVPPYRDDLKLGLVILTVRLAMPQSSPETARTYQDPQHRFQFSYPEVFGTPSPGSDNEFRSRTAAIRFSKFSSGVHAGRIILGGEAVLTAGPLQLDLQTAGGLYDPMTLQIFPARIATVVQNALPALTLANLCDALGREHHLDPADRGLSTLTAQQRGAIPKIDRMGNVAPKVLHCEILAGTVTFDKESAFDPAGPDRHIYGAIRFLRPRYSSFQLIRGSPEAPSMALLEQMTAVVNSWKER